MTAATGYAVWAVLAAVTLGVWAMSRATWKGRRVVVRPASALTRLATDPWLRVPLVLGWAWVGWHLFVR